MRPSAMSEVSLEFVIKHAGKTYPIKLSENAKGSDLKNEVVSLTNVPIERQKYMVKGGKLNDDVLVSTLIKPKQTVMLLGTPDAGLIHAPAKKQKFLEDKYQPEDLHNTSKEHANPNIPLGLKNLGNTCYANSTLQAIYQIDPIREAVLALDPSTNASNPEDEPHLKLIKELKLVFREMRDKKQPQVFPGTFIMQLRQVYPNFKEIDQATSIYKQQDAEEMFTLLMNSLRIVFPKVMDCSTIEFLTKITDLNNPSDVSYKNDDVDTKLQCHISSSTNFLKNGLQNSLTETLEKNSSITNTNSTFEYSKKITRLPEYLTVQYVRFFWKKSSGKKSKILRKVTFPFQLDVADLLEPEYAAKKIDTREKLRDVDRRKQEEERELRKQKQTPNSSNTSLDVPSGMTQEEFDAMDPMELEVLKKSLEESRKEKWAAEFKSEFPENLSGGENASCLYNLVAIITHKGANSESGHYQSFIKDTDNDEVWYKYNDDQVSTLSKEKVELLAGGGESDSALILIYKAFGL